MNKNTLSLFALVLAVLSFFNLLGIEKAIFAILAGLLALSRPTESRWLSWIAIGLGLAFLVAFAAITIFHAPALAHLFGKQG